MFHVDSEVGRLRQVILHRPDLELKRLTPDNAADLLFDDVLWVSRAQAEHDAFAEALRARGRRGPLLRRPAGPDAGGPRGPRRTSWTGSSTRAARAAGRRHAARRRGGARLGRAGAVPDRRDHQAGDRRTGPRARRASRSTRWTPTASCSPRCRTCSTSATPPAGSTAGCRSTRCAGRPGCGRPSATRPSTAGTRCSPRRVRGLVHGADAAPATIEGGDILVLGNGAVLVGMSERTTAAGRRDARPPAVRGRGGPLPGRDRHAEVPGVHAPGHRC